MAKGKGWVIANSINSGVVELEFHILKEDRGDECTCIGLSTEPEPPTGTDYKSKDSCFLVLRCFNGEVHKEGKVVHRDDHLKAHPGDTVKVS